MASPQDPIFMLTRRQIVAYGFSAAVGGVSLAGCGGSERRSSGGSTKPGTVAISGTVSLPAGLSSTGLTFVAGLSQSPVGGGKVKAKVVDGSPSLASVVDGASGRVVLLGMIAPEEGRFSLDSANLAATLIFLGLGGSQLGDTDRQTLWTLLATGAATATLASVVTARLASDPFALENGDATLKAAIAVAIAASGGKPRGKSRPSQKTKKGRADLIRPSPAVHIDLPSNSNGFALGSLSHATAPDGIASLPDFLSLTTVAPVETALYVYREIRTGSTVTSVRRLVGPTSLKPSRETLAQSDPIPLSLDEPTDAIEVLGFVGLAPIFDAPGGVTGLDPAYISALGEWTAQLGPLWQRTVVLMAADIAFEAVGVGRAFYAAETLSQSTTALSSATGASPILLGAAGGRDFARHVDELLDFASGSDGDARAFLSAVSPLAPADYVASPERLIQARGVLRVSDLTGLYVSAATYGRVYKAVQYDATIYAVNPIDFASPGSLNRVIPKLTPERTTYAPNGATVGFTLAIDPTAYIEMDSTLTYHWKVFGAGTTRLSDGKGKGGTEFDTKEKFVTLAPGDDASGVQTVSVEAFSTLTGSKFSVGKASASISAAGSSHLALTSEATRPIPGGTGGWTVAYDGNINVGGWPGIDASHLRFRWEIDSSSLGLLGVASGTGTTVETTKNAILFFAKADAQDGDTVGMRVTVSVVDPSTGAFTNLAVLTGSVRVDVGNHCRFEIIGSSFSLETLRYPEPVRVLEAKSGSFKNDDAGAFASATYARPGSTSVDFVGLVFRPTGGYEAGASLRVEVEGASGPVSATTLYPATGFPYFSASATSGTARILDVAKNGAGTVTYLKAVATIEFVESGSGRSLSADITCGIGVVP